MTWDCHDGKAGQGIAVMVGVVGGRERAATFMPLLRNGSPKKNRLLLQRVWLNLKKKKKKAQLVSKHWSVMHTSTCHHLCAIPEVACCKCGVLSFSNHQDTVSNQHLVSRTLSYKNSMKTTVLHYILKPKCLMPSTAMLPPWIINFKNVHPFTGSWNTENYMTHQSQT